MVRGVEGDICRNRDDPISLERPRDRLENDPGISHFKNDLIRHFTLAKATTHLV
jgi:hypothetical protein